MRRAQSASCIGGGHKTYVDLEWSIQTIADFITSVRLNFSQKTVERTFERNRKISGLGAISLQIVCLAKISFHQISNSQFITKDQKHYKTFPSVFLFFHDPISES